jgi:hypothetical protein
MGIWVRNKGTWFRVFGGVVGNGRVVYRFGILGLANIWIL